MNRLQKKCFIVTSALHGLLIAVLLFGSALMRAPKDENNAKLFTVVDIRNITDGESKGGDLNVAIPVAPLMADNPQPKPQVETTPAPVKVEPKIEPKVEPKVEPVAVKLPPKLEPKVEPKVEPRAEPKNVHEVHNDLPKLRTEKKIEKKQKLNPEDLVPVTSKTKPPRKPTIDTDSLKPVVRKADDKAKAAKEAADAAEKEAQRAAARAEREQHRIAAQQFATTLRSLGKNLSTHTLVQMTPGSGGGGEASVNYRDLIASKYYNAWSPPTFLDEATPVVTATVTIGSDGNLISAHIVKPSGNSAMDKSIQNVLEIVNYFEPFPSGSSDRQRTFTIHFNLQAKRQIG